MRVIKNYGLLLGLSAVLVTSGCATPNASQSEMSSSSVAYAGRSVVQSIELLTPEARGSSGVGLGTLAGAVLGGIVGNQVGSGSGNTAATVIGVAGGAYAGHEMENRSKQIPDEYKVVVRMDDGAYQSMTQNGSAGLRVGDRVQIVNGAAQHY